MAIIITTSTAAAAQDVRPLADVRLRYENVDQDGIDEDAQALTARARVGIELKSGAWSILAEGEGTLALAGRYDNGLDGEVGNPLIADPDNIEMNRLQLQYRILPGTLVTVGRQRINLDDQRFVGSVGWRQNEQTFDSVRIESSVARTIKADLTYAWSDRTIWGIDGHGARQQAVGGDNVFANIAWTGAVGTLTAFAYLVDQDEAEVQNYRMSSKTFGIRLAGSRPVGGKAVLAYVLSYARQSDYHRNPNDYSTDYGIAEINLKLSEVSFGIGYERLGGDNGLPFTSFQTPLATLHKFQGWADKFTVTPPNGIQDAYATVAFARKNVLGFDSVAAMLVRHGFYSARLNEHYGDEWDVQLSGKRGRWTATAKLAAYDAIDFATDTGKFWLQLEWAY